MKTLTINRGAANVPFECESGDLYDSTAELVDVNGNLLWDSTLVNTDSTRGYHGGRLAEGNYYGRVGYRASGLRVIRLFSLFPGEPMPRHADDLTIDQMTLPSDIPNANHDGAYIIRYVQIHRGGVSNDYSHGCITILNQEPYHDMDTLLAQLQDNETIRVVLQ